MDFFKPVISGDLDPSQPLTDSQPNSPSDNSLSPPDSNADPNLPSWSFGGLIRTLTTRSESVIQAYRRDLQEFGSELKKEIQVAQGSLGAVGSAIDDLGTSVFRETAQVISQGKELILAGQEEPESSSGGNSDRDSSQQSSNPKGYSRFDTRVRVLQEDISTYCEEPEDMDDYRCWREGLVLDAQREEIQRLLKENGAVKCVFDKLVPGSVDDATFWFRYFYKVFKLKKAQDLRANVVKRAISPEDDDEEELSWDIDDDYDGDEEEEKVVKDYRNVTSNPNFTSEENVDRKCSQVKAVAEDKHEFSLVRGPEGVISEVALERQEEQQKVLEAEVKRNGESSGETVAIKKVVSEESGRTDMEGSVFMSDEKMVVELRPEIEESNRSSSNGKESDFSVVSSHPSWQEEDLEWAEIEDLSMIDDKRMDHGGSLSNDIANTQMPLKTPEEEDLSWDVDDDDEPAENHSGSMKRYNGFSIENVPIKKVISKRCGRIGFQIQ